METHKILYISDLDGTLLNYSAKLSEYSENSINKLIERGLNFSIATARIPAKVKKILAKLKLNVPIILMNGALIYDIKQDSYVKVNRIPLNTTKAVIQLLREFKITGFMYAFNNGDLTTYHETFDAETHDYVKERIINYSDVEGFPDEGLDDIVYFTMIDTPERLKPVADALLAQPGLNQAFYINVYCPDVWFLEVYDSEASKQSAVNYLRETFNFDRIIGFGDNLNDLPMFEACDFRIAVENANSEVKAKADHICNTNDNDGVAKWLEENCNK